jgi:catechol 2,3-dioxygenase-like lactoylglutathione lyase family enzyme
MAEVPTPAFAEACARRSASSGKGKADEAMGNASVDHVALVVTDLARSVEFYESIGFAFERHIEFVGPGAEQVTGVGGARLEMAFLGLGAFRLELIEYDPPGAGRPGAANDIGCAHICLRVDDIERAHRELEGRGVRFVSRPHHHPSGVSMVYFADPDGNLLELLEVRADDAG